VEPVTDASGRIDHSALSAAVHAWVARDLPVLRASANYPGVPVAGIAPWSAPLGWIAPAVFCATTQACGSSSLPAMAVQLVLRAAPSELPPSGLLSGLTAAGPPGVAGLMVLNAAGVLPLSLAALAALALPGAGGLTLFTAAGVRLGYRQAKAGFVVQTAGVARFARPGAGPLGVVRSGSLLVLRPRAAHVARARASSTGSLLDKVA
jgi:hypothetical protein